MAGDDVDTWSFRQIRWGKVWRRQDHANALLTVLLAVGVALCTFVIEPREREWYIYDATLSNPPATKRGFDPTVPNWVAVIIPLLSMVLTLLVGEFYYSKQQHHSVTDAVAVTLYFLMDAIQSLLCTLLVTQATKVAVGWLRPDFITRCAPLSPGNLTIQYGQDTAPLYPCTNPDSGVIKEGRQSFPSGHTSSSFNLASYSSGYLIWCWNMRRQWAPRRQEPWTEFLSDLGNVVAKVWMLIMLATAWGISMSRIVDNQHHPADVVAGMVLGVVIAVMYIMRAVPRYRRVLTMQESQAAFNGARNDEELCVVVEGRTPVVLP